MAQTLSQVRIILVMTALMFFFASSTTHAQQAPYKRGVIVEEFTGTWCGYCPRGAWFIDSLQEYMPDNAIEISWHNADEMTIPKVEDTIEGYFGVQGFPNVGIQRYASGDIDDWQGETDPMYGYIQGLANQKPMVDFRLVNISYDPASKEFNADVDVTPFDMTKMPADGIATYVTIGVLTEDGLVYDQHNYGLRGDPDNPIPEFIHENVARAVAGKVKGNPFTLGTKSANPTLPVRIHYTMTAKTGWDPTKLRFKTFVNGVMDTVINGAHYTNPHVYDAKQSAYLTTYPSTAPDAAWVVLPNRDSKISTPTANIIWAKGGNVSNVKIEYSTNSGNTWNPIAGATNISTSPYTWTHGFTSSTTVEVRVTDASNINTFGVSDAFTINPIKGTYTITRPAAGTSIPVGTTNYSIQYSSKNAGSQPTFSLSTDGGVTYSPITGTQGNGTFTWATVPNTPTTQAVIKISDEAGASGISGMFTIVSKPSGAINTLTLGGVVNNSIIGGTQMDITWAASGDVGSGLVVEYSTDNQATWNLIKNVAATANEALWTTPVGSFPNSFVRVRSADADKSTVVATSNQFAITSTAGVYSGNSSNGYSISNYPNPFSGKTTLTFTLPVSTSVTINVLDNLGRVVDHQVTKTLEAGTHQMPFNAADLANGVYTYTLEAGSVRLAGKMSIVK